MFQNKGICPSSACCLKTRDSVPVLFFIKNKGMCPGSNFDYENKGMCPGSNFDCENKGICPGSNFDCEQGFMSQFILGWMNDAIG